MTKKTPNNEGASLILALLIVGIVLIIAVTVANLGLGELRLSRSAGESVRAFYTANAGIERALYECRQNGYTGDLENASFTPGTVLGGDGEYRLTGSCDESGATITATGIFPVTGADRERARRAIEASY